MSGGGGGSDDDTDKTHEPSQKKLDDARKKGEVPKSTDLITTGAYAGLLLAGLMAGAGSLSRLGEILATLLAQADSLGALVGGGSGTVIGGRLMVEVGQAMAPWALLPISIAFVSVLAQRAFVVTGSKLQPKLNRISPISGAKNKFGRGGLFEFAKSFVKLTIYSVVLFIFLMRQMPDILSAVAYEPALVTELLCRLALQFLALVLVISVVIGGIDFFWQQAEHIRKHRMSHKEMTDEHKESEGDPHMKQQRRQKGYDIATNQMMKDVPDASVVVVNPTHYAVALKWNRSDKGAPACVAKGTDEIAARIREIATKEGVPIHSDPPTARAIHATVEVGEEIRSDQYGPVAVAIRFAEDMRRKARAR